MATKKLPQVDPLDALVDGPREKVIALMLWKNRHQDPSMTAVLRPDDIQGLEDCCAHLKITPAVAIVRPAGRAATPAIPARGNRPGIPAMPAEAPRPHVVVALVAKGTMDAIVPLENNDDDAELLHRTTERKRWQSKAMMLAGSARGMASGGDVSTAVLNEIAECLQVFAGE
jgi:hypothetical protein